MKKALTRAVLIGGASLAALAIGMGSASAAPTFTVAAGSAPTGTTVQVSGATTGSSPQIVFTTSNNTVLQCVSGSATGQTKTGTKLPGTAIATINGTSTVFKTCTGPFGLTFTVTGTSTPWTLNATSGTSSGASGTLTGIKAHVDGGANCAFDVAGSVAATYTDTNTSLNFPGTTSTLNISNVTGGCFGAISSGTTASFKASYKITATTAAYNPVTITSP